MLDFCEYSYHPLWVTSKSLPPFAINCLAWLPWVRRRSETTRCSVAVPVVVLGVVAASFRVAPAVPMARWEIGGSIGTAAMSLVVVSVRASDNALRVSFAFLLVDILLVPCREPRDGARVEARGGCLLL